MRIHYQRRDESAAEEGEGDLLERLTGSALRSASVGEALEGMLGEGRRGSRELDALRRSVREAIERRLSSGNLRDVAEEVDAILSSVASGEPAEPRERIRDARRLRSFLERWGNAFDGERPLTFDEALELMEAIEALKALDHRLERGRLTEEDGRAIDELLDDEAAGAWARLHAEIDDLERMGWIHRTDEGWALTGRGARKIGAQALRTIRRSLESTPTGAPHDRRGSGGETREGSPRVWEYGSATPFDAVATVRAAAKRRAAGGQGALAPEDFRVREWDGVARSSTVLLVDCSWSMSWNGRLEAAKRVALALETLIRTKYPRDRLHVVGFYTRARRLDVRELPTLSWNAGEPFTNLQAGLRLARRLLLRDQRENRQIIVVTDGQPTAYYSGSHVYCEWPQSFGGLCRRASVETLREVRSVTREGIRINTFMLDDSPELLGFVERMTKINRGRSFLTSPDHLGAYVLVDYAGHRTRRAA